jgi:hypothetical protein
MRTKEVNNQEGVLIGHLIECPACTKAGFGSVHLFHLKMNNGSPGWTFNDDFERPTFSPSMLSRAPSNGRVPQETFVCHSFVRDGQIQYLSDCTHELAGQTVDLPDMT